MRSYWLVFNNHDYSISHYGRSRIHLKYEKEDNTQNLKNVKLEV